MCEEDLFMWKLDFFKVIIKLMINTCMHMDNIQWGWSLGEIISKYIVPEAPQATALSPFGSQSFNPGGNYVSL